MEIYQWIIYKLFGGGFSKLTISIFVSQEFEIFMLYEYEFDKKIFLCQWFAHIDILLKELLSTFQKLRLFIPKILVRYITPDYTFEFLIYPHT